MAWAEAREAPGTRQIRHGNGWQGSVGSCIGASPPGRTRCLSCATRRCASRPGAYAGGIVAGARASARPWRLVRRAELRKVQAWRLRWALAGVPLPTWGDGRIRLAVDVSNWLRPDAATSPDRSFCHCYGRGNNSAQITPGWPYSLVAALEPGRTSWTLLLDAVRLGPDDDLATMTAAQVRGVIERIIAAGHWHDGDPDIMVIFDAGYEPARLARLLRDLPCRCWGGWAPTGLVYVVFVVEIYSRAIVGWAAAAHKRAKLVPDALDMALWRRDRAGTRQGGAGAPYRRRVAVH
jgi:hypothetical protein